ncbi:hypothetical protein RJ639_042859 [Escallonia herrerae]|uniref:LOB domain-containing protein n=1 Tax=Escallonia herrerae TaxID=1293975 RepID=A0AA89B0C3_9ASTE|nr:hypothetical protein RJ639_042859 [Escallonia herrerae]
MSSTNSPCAACKFLRRKCTQECVFAPYFPPDQPQKFANVHKVFGASNVAKLLNDLQTSQREDAVNSLAYEAEARLRDPVYGCVGLIFILQQRLKQVQHDLFNAKKELSNYIGPSAMLPMLQHPGYMHPNNPSSSAVMQYNMQPMLGLPAGPSHFMIREPQHHQQMMEAQQLAAAREQQQMMRSYEQQQHPQQQAELVRFSGGVAGFDVAGPGQVTASGFNQLTPAGAMSPSLALGGSYEATGYHIQQQGQQDQHSHHSQHHHHQLQPQLLLQQHQGQVQAQQPQGQHDQQQQQQRDGSEEGVGPSC